MAINPKLAKERATAKHIAEMTSHYFEELPKAEQKARFIAMKNLGIGIEGLPSIIPLRRVFRNISRPQ